MLSVRTTGAKGVPMRSQPRVCPVVIHERRRGVRVNSRVPVTLEWEEAPGVSRQENTFTRVVGPFGCLLVLKENLALEQRLDVTNLATQQRTAARVVWKGSGRDDGWELGLVLERPPANFWGLDL
jgi:hypothetical protein